MKKYLFGLIALIAVTVFSAFTIAGADKQDATLEYYFFEVENGAVNPLAPLNEEPMTIEEFELVNPVDCPTGDDADCIRAWEDGHTPTSTGTADYVIRKDI